MPNAILRLCVIALLSALALSAADNPFGWSEYRKAVITPTSAGRQLVTAGIAQWRDSPEEWGQGMAGYGRRYASRLATHAVIGSIEFGVAAWRHEDLKYKPSDLQGKWSRVKYAVKATFIVPRTDRPGTTVSAAVFAGAFGGGAISRLWHPADVRTVGSALSSGGLTVGYDVAGHILKEFWPRKNKSVQTKDRKR